MSETIRKFALIVSLALLLHGLLPTPLRAQQQEDNDNPRFVQISPANGTVVAATLVTITGQVEDASPVEVEMDEVTVKADAEGRFTQ